MQLAIIKKELQLEIAIVCVMQDIKSLYRYDARKSSMEAIVAFPQTHFIPQTHRFKYRISTY